MQNSKLHIRKAHCMQFKIQKDNKSQEIFIFNKGFINPVDLTYLCNKNNDDIEILIFILLQKNNKLILNTKNIISAKNVTAYTFIKAVLFDKAKLEHAGLIKIEKSGKLANAYLSCKVLLLGDRATAFSKPYLEIEVNDIKASHGSSIGRLAEEELFYLKSRGLSQQQAEKLLVQGFFDEQISKIDSFPIQEKVREYLQQLYLTGLTPRG